jgi:hypothetical protein
MLSVTSKKSDMEVLTSCLLIEGICRCGADGLPLLAAALTGG